MKKTLFAIPALILALSGSAFADTWEDVSVRTALSAMNSAPALSGGIVTRYAVAVKPDASSPPFFTNFIAAGIAVPGVPCFGCVNGAPGSALGLPAPFNYVPSGSTEQFNVSWTNLTFKGTCKVTMAVTSGKKVIETASANIPGINGAGGYDWGINFAPVKYSGPAVLTGKLTCGSKSSASTAKMIFQ